MGKVFSIPIKPFKKQLFCRHMWYRNLFNANDDYNKFSKGIQLHKVCLKCGKLKRYRWISRNSLQFYWQQIRVYNASKFKVYVDSSVFKCFKSTEWEDN